ncbi:hypothetical protein SAMN02745121_00342 [Nannocystis exedens]|uniref:Uncharacterized protein n=1 Tax=Nannocystis exedens TaxID=54 RepID=A0A1I1T1R4_9BACT|nr:hypothetical protein NAEX_09526 [Nannocystis exedens]SFD50998.1 hypothetical protein SAMN02745121_00342 [Nannocystis exedens]
MPGSAGRSSDEPARHLCPPLVKTPQHRPVRASRARHGGSSDRRDRHAIAVCSADRWPVLQPRCWPLACSGSAPRATRSSQVGVGPPQSLAHPNLSRRPTAAATEFAARASTPAIRRAADSVVAGRSRTRSALCPASPSNSRHRHVAATAALIHGANLEAAVERAVRPLQISLAPPDAHAARPPRRFASLAGPIPSLSQKTACRSIGEPRGRGAPRTCSGRLRCPVSMISPPAPAAALPRRRRDDVLGGMPSRPCDLARETPIGPRADTLPAGRHVHQDMSAARPWRSSARRQEPTLLSGRRPGDGDMSYRPRPATPLGLPCSAGAGSRRRPAEKTAPRVRSPQAQRRGERVVAVARVRHACVPSEALALPRSDPLGPKSGARMSARRARPISRPPRATSHVPEDRPARSRSARLGARGGPPSATRRRAEGRPAGTGRRISAWRRRARDAGQAGRPPAAGGPGSSVGL